MGKSSLNISASTLSGVDIFSGLTPREREEVAGLCRGNEYRKNDVIVSHLEQGTDVFFVISGTVRITIYSNSGREIAFRDLSAGQMFGELSAVDRQPRSAHVIAISNSTLAFMSADQFWTVLNRFPPVTRKTLVYLAQLVRLLSDRVVELGTLGAKNRIHAELLRLGRSVDAHNREIEITPAPTHLEIANRVISNREAVTREMSELARQGILHKKGNTLVIHDMDVLEKMVAEVLNDRK